jgi:plastocyanin
MVRRVPLLSVVLFLLALLFLFVFPIRARADQTVLVTDFAFIPRDITISVGETITWQWVKGFHTTTNGIDENDPNAGTLWDAQLFSGKKTAFYQFNQAGFFPYFCRFHTVLDMFGSVTVNPPTSTEATTWGAIKSLYQ